MAYRLRLLSRRCQQLIITTRKWGSVSCNPNPYHVKWNTKGNSSLFCQHGLKVRWASHSTIGQCSDAWTMEVKDDHLLLNLEAVDLKFPYFWLRDNCRCSDCFHPQTHQIMHEFTDLDLHIRPADVNTVGDEVHITWNDNHKSSFTTQWLQKHAPGTRENMKTPSSILRVLWQGSTLGELPTFPLSELESEGGALRSLFRMLDQYGLAIIEGVSTSTEAMESLAFTIAGGIESTFYSQGVTVMNANLEIADTGYTNIALPLHTDTTYFSTPCRAMMIHITKRDGQGGQTILSDGFFALERLRQSKPEYFDILCNTKLICQYVGENRNIRAMGPVIKLNPDTNQVECLRFNPLDRAVISHLPYHQMLDFYKAYQALARELYKKEHSLTIQLNPGQVLLFDNWRVLHGRKSFTGNRVFKSAYLRKDDWMSQMRTVGGLNV